MGNSMKTALESMYIGTMTVYETSYVLNDDTGAKEPSENPVMTDIPCRLSFETTNSNDQSNSAAITQEIQLFYGTGVTIKPGSRIAVTQNGVTVSYELSGQPAIYESHRQVKLKLYEERA